MANVNLDALIPREDFAYDQIAEGAQEAQGFSPTLKLNELEPDNLWYLGLRKPDFQRETTEWKPERIATLVKTFVDGDLIPGVILWRHRSLTFVIDGSHRLSALIAWVHDDYGDGKRSRELFSESIDEKQQKLARKTRSLVNEQVGSYRELLMAGRNPESHSPEMVKRAREIAVRTLQLQWVTGNTEKAERSFHRINQQVSTISAQELELLKNRELPNTISSRAIWRRAMGHQYWSAFEPKEQQKIKELASDTHDLLFVPPTDFPLRTSDLSVGGPVHAGLRMVYDYVNLCIEHPTGEKDADGTRTIAYLTRAQRVMRLIANEHPSSLGLHPIVYFYSWTGRHQPLQFLTVVDFVIRLEKEERLNEFTALRGRFEEFLVSHRPALQQVIRAHGSVATRRKEIVQYFQDVVNTLGQGRAPAEILPVLAGDKRYKYLRKPEPFTGTEGEQFSRSVTT